MGLNVDTALTNAQAAERLRARDYDLLISDIYRDNEEAHNAGLRLPREASPDRNRLPPVVYYVGKVAAPRTDEGYPVIGRQRELFSLVNDLVETR
jgi:hypothetical protein